MAARKLHYFCALCGGPFAQVYRSAEPACYAQPAVDRDELHAPEEALVSGNEFDFAGEENRVIPEEVVEEDICYAARRARRTRLQAERQRRGLSGEQRIVRQAYDGRFISGKQMRWTKNLRALIHCKSKNQPLNWQRYVQNGETAYLTGRGLVRQGDNWADAYASIEEDEEEIETQEEGAGSVHTEYPSFSNPALFDNTYGFQLYRETGHPKAFISSIPFHDECWTLLDLAIEESGLERGLERMNEEMDLGHMWNHLRGLISVSGERQDNEFGRLHAEGGKRAVTRLDEVDYREAQGGGEGFQWKHEDGYHVNS
jgi:hypothetical protein